MARIFDYCWFSQASVALVAVLLWAGAESVEASIIVAEQPSMEVEWLLPDAGASSGSGSPSSRLPVRNPDEEPLDRDSRHDDRNLPNNVLFAPSQPFSGGTTSGASTAGSGANAGGAFVINSATQVPCTDIELVGRVAGERSFVLPIPPENELLRPPQVL